jgi:hypothetical protein
MKFVIFYNFYETNKTQILANSENFDWNEIEMIGNKMENEI